MFGELKNKEYEADAQTEILMYRPKTNLNMRNYLVKSRIIQTQKLGNDGKGHLWEIGFHILFWFMISSILT